MDLRRYELVTLAAARRLRSSYCCLAHGKMLLEQFDEPVRDIALDHRAAGLDEVDVAVMDFAEKIVDDACRITERGPREAESPRPDRQGHPRRHPGSNGEMLLLEDPRRPKRPPDAHFEELDDEVREALVVGRPIAEA